MAAFRFTHWPTVSKRINQVYNNNPDYYSQFGLTGHEGVDIGAPFETRIVAVAAGTVYKIRHKDEEHAYGNAVYVRHAGGYRTAYGHLRQVNVREGDEVQGGDLIGLADSTGNVFPKPTPENPTLGTHLHITLYKDGATADGLTEQPFDIVDPTPFLDMLLGGDWEPPQEPLFAAWGWANSIERSGNLGRVSNPGGINLRAQPDTGAAIRTLAPHGTVLRITGNARNGYLPLQASTGLLEEEPSPDEEAEPEPAPPPPSEWAEPAEPVVAAWGFANSIERKGDLGRVAHEGGINLRAEPHTGAAILTLLPVDTIVRIAGELRNGYLPIQVSARLVEGEEEAPPPPPAEAAHDYEFLTFASTLGDYTNVQPGRTFTATWTIRNSGRAAWSDDFQLVHITDAERQETKNHRKSRLGAEAAYTLGELRNQERVEPGETATLRLTLVAPTAAGAYVSDWQLRTPEGDAVNGPLWLRLTVRGAARPTDRAPAGAFQPGVNINPDLHEPDVERLRGLDWVRFVWKADSRHRTVEEAFHEQYNTLLRDYAEAGIKSVIVLNQQTFWGTGPWGTHDPGAWRRYAERFAGVARRIAALVAPLGDVAAYEIWAHPDSELDNPHAVGIEPQNYAPLLARTARAIREVDPDAPILFGSLIRPLDEALAYARNVRDHLEGDLPVDAMNYHPYHRYVHTDPFHNRHFGTVQAAIRRFRDSFPELPLWITEMGVASDHPISPDRYPDVALVMREVVDEIARNHTGDVPVLIWYAWSDLMRNAGITTVDGTMKPHIADAFEAMIRRARDAAAPEHFSFAPATARADSEFQRFETTLDNHNAVPAGSTFTNRWYFRNSGGTTWGDGCRLVYAPRGGATAARMLPQAEYPLADVASPLPAAPGDEIVVQLQMTAPERAGRHVQSRWELQDARGNSFGHLFAEITTIAPSPVGTGAHHANMGFIADHTVPDDTRFPAGEAFLKQWRVRNNGARKWGDSFRLVFIEGDLQMAAGVASHTVPGAAPGESIVLSVEMVAPTPPAGRNTATFKSLWRLQDDRGNFFGDTLWARIVSVRTGAATGANLGRFTDPAGWYSQRDERWEKTQLGTGAETIGGWGCLMTCYAMMLYSYGLKLTPDALNERLCGLGSAGFDGSIVQFAAPPRLVPQLKLGRNMRSWRTPELPWTVWTGEDPIQRIDTSLAKGYTVLAQVDMGPNDAYNATNEQHWVILVSRTPAGDDYLMLDPMTPPEQLHQQPLSLMRKYGNPHPNRTPQENLRHAIKSALIYYT